VVDELMAREGKILELSFEDDDEPEGLEPFDATSEAELVAQFEEFLDQVKPEDFDA
jgi:hypothetical protein